MSHSSSRKWHFCWENISINNVFDELCDILSVLIGLCHFKTVLLCKNWLNNVLPWQYLWHPIIYRCMNVLNGHCKDFIWFIIQFFTDLWSVTSNNSCGDPKVTLKLCVWFSSSHSGTLNCRVLGCVKVFQSMWLSNPLVNALNRVCLI